MAFLIALCSSSSAFADWGHVKRVDDFTGYKWEFSIVKSGDAALYASTTIKKSGGQILNEFLYFLGDHYICAPRDKLKVDYKFGDESPEFVQGFTGAKKNVLFLGLGSSEDDWHNEFTRKLSENNVLMIRTLDTCGNQITNRFDISGSTHFTPRAE